MANNIFPKLQYAKVNPVTFTPLIGMSVPLKSKVDSGKVGKFVHQLILDNLKINENNIVDIDKYGIEIKSKGIESNTDWSIGSMTVDDIINTSYIDSPIYKKMQALLLVTTDNSLAIICDVGLYYMDLDEVQLLIQDTYEDVRSQLKREVENMINSSNSTIMFNPSQSFKGKYGRFEYTNFGNTFNFRIKQGSMNKFKNIAATQSSITHFFDLLW